MLITLPRRIRRPVAVRSRVEGSGDRDAEAGEIEIGVEFLPIVERDGGLAGPVDGDGPEVGVDDPRRPSLTSR